MRLSNGIRLGPYEIVSPLGAGGMGEVYRARDARLGRDVAVMVVPASFVADISRLHRFEQEARAVAALNHPNILAVFDIGQHDGSPFLVSELLEGESLRDVLEALEEQVVLMRLLGETTEPAILTVRIGAENEVAERRTAFADYQVDDDLFRHADPGAIFMHCLPAKRGEEVTDSVIESSRSVVFDQAENRLHAQKALLLMLLA